MDRQERNFFIGFFKEELMAQEEQINEAKRNRGR